MDITPRFLSTRLKQLLPIVAVVVLIFPPISIAQLSNLSIEIGSQFFELNSTEPVVYTVRNASGADIVTPFTLKVWASMDDTFNEEDLYKESSVFNGLQINAFESLRLNFRLPIPEDNRVEPPYLPASETRRPIEWLGKPVYLKACISSASTDVSCESRPLYVLPPSPKLPRASRGISTEMIELTWPVPAADQGTFLEDSYIVREFGLFSFLERNIDVVNLEVFDQGLGSYYRWRFSGRPSGSRYIYSNFAACSDRGSPSIADPYCSLPNKIPIEFGTTLAIFNASIEEVGQIGISWDQLYQTSNDFYLTRCEVDQPEICVDIGLGYTSPTSNAETSLERGELQYFINGTSFTDTTAERGKEYIYTVHVCDLVDSDQCVEQYPFGITNQGNISLVDGFEDDDNFATAQEIHRSINQLHSFDTADDQDWFKLIIDRPQAVQMITSGPLSYDTEITLYNAQTQQIDYNDDAETTFAKLTTTELAVGEYFIKVNQKVDPDPFFYRPVPNYNFKVEMKSKVITPIIMLLLDDG